MTQTEFLRHLKAYRRVLPRQTLLTLRGQALSGDVDGALRGLAHILKKKIGNRPAIRLTFVAFRALMSSR